MNLTITIAGTFEFDPAGIASLKHNQQVHQVISLGNVDVGHSLSFAGGAVTVTGSITNDNNQLDLDIKVTLFGVLQLFDDKIDLTNLPRVVNVNFGSPQLGFMGTISVADGAAA
jgi:hypothetical protein